ncbi:MAG: hypothetical protein AB7H92_16645, partial [Microbacteriaceae bacterium]
DPSVGGAANNSFAGIADPGMTAYTSCPAGEGLVARSVWDNGYSNSLDGAYMIFDAPAGTYVESIHGYFLMQRGTCDWAAHVAASNGDLWGTSIYGLDAGVCGTDRLNWTYADLGVNASRVRIEARCGATYCYRGQGYTGAPGTAAAQMHSVRVTVRDDSAPNLSNGQGALWTGAGWLGGSQQLSFDAADNVGIRETNVLIDGNPTLGIANGCDYTLRVPCPNQGFSGAVDLRTVRPDGLHTLTLRAVDTAGNPATASRTIRVDNTPPAAPRDLAVVGGDGWRSSNAFSVSWTNPDPGGGAPVGGARYKLCPTDGPVSKCVAGEQSGSLLSLSDLKVPADGDWKLTLWLVDAAGNASADLAAQPVRLRLDRGAPQLAFRAPDPADPTLVTVDADDGDGSGLASGQIEIRSVRSQTWRPLPTTLTGGRLTARLPDTSLRRGAYLLQARGVDQAGNERSTGLRADGQPAQITLPVRLRTKLKAGKRVGHREWVRLKHRVRVRYGRAVRISGRLTTVDGNPIANTPLLVYSRARRTSAPTRLIGTVTTSRKGGYSYVIRKGVSRAIRFRYAGTPTIRSASGDVAVLVRASSTIHPRRRSLVNGETIRLHGTLRGTSIPNAGKLVELQVKMRGRYRTFATTRASRGGRWRYDYRFDGTRGQQIYRMRVRIPREATYPYEPGSSPAITVAVRGL